MSRQSILMEDLLYYETWLKNTLSTNIHFTPKLIRIEKIQFKTGSSKQMDLAPFECRSYES